MSKYIEVLQEDIDRAIANCSNRCAVAEAIRRYYPTAVRMRVDLATIRFTLPEKQKRYIYLTPAKAQEYIIAFDAGEKLEPFSFRLDVQGRQTIPSQSMPAEVQLKLHERAHNGRRVNTKVEKIGGKAPPRLGPSTSRGFGICGLRINKDKVTVNRDVDAETTDD